MEGRATLQAQRLRQRKDKAHSPNIPPAHGVGGNVTLEEMSATVINVKGHIKLHSSAFDHADQKSSTHPDMLLAPWLKEAKEKAEGNASWIAVVLDCRSIGLSWCWIGQCVATSQHFDSCWGFTIARRFLLRRFP